MLSVLPSSSDSISPTFSAGDIVPIQEKGVRYIVSCDENIVVSNFDKSATILQMEEELDVLKTFKIGDKDYLVVTAGSEFIQVCMKFLIILGSPQSNN
jgi:hypothetical protein